MDNVKLKKILNKHLKWLKGKNDEERADLSRVDLNGSVEEVN